MDATVNDFLNEINQLSSKSDVKEQPDGMVWQECYDEVTGFSYFWNTDTDEVTWVPPKSYKPAKNASEKPTAPKVRSQVNASDKEKKKTELFVPPSSTSQLPAASVKPETKLKVYSIQESIRKPNIKPPLKSEKKPFRRASDSDDEKIELITEFGGDSDSASDIETYEKNNKLEIVQSDKTHSPPAKLVRAPVRKPFIETKALSPQKRPILSDNEEEEDDDDIDLLAKIQQRAQELKQLGGEVPPSVTNIIQNSEVPDNIEKPKTVSGFSLVAGYNSDSLDSEPEEQAAAPPKAVFPVAPPPKPIPEMSHSTLFPITKPIDVKDFTSTEPTTNDAAVSVDTNGTPNNSFDSKAFQRKRRIGISLVNSGKRPKDDPEIASSEFSGLGFKADESKNDETEAPKYSGFQKGGVMFVKSDEVLNPLQSLSGKEVDKKEIDQEESRINKKETEDDYTVLREKLLFLGEGRTPVLPVQVMLIQAETLFLAMKEGGLKLSYLYKWLKDMCSELIKLEKEAAPEGWLLQWDRSHKRYYYQNQVTGVSQWRYPEPDVTRCDDAMDISTTPPPSDLHDNANVKPPSPVVFGPQLPVDPPLPPSPPQIRSPTPPPPPMISMAAPQTTNITDVPLPSEPPLPEPVVLPPSLLSTNDQPLPPGVDFLTKSKESEVAVPDTLSNALDSFYSEIAEVTENTNPVSSQTMEISVEKVLYAPSSPSIEVLKKKKKKVKLAQGLTMKQKGVSKLVEKWKNVQKSYED